MRPTAATQARITPRRIGETLTEYGAKRLANVIEKYWCGRGYQGIRCTIEHDVGWAAEHDRERAIFIVRSNLGPLGFPPREALADSKANGSQKDIAKTAGVSHPHVAKVRSDLEKSGHVETVTASIARAKEAA